MESAGDERRDPSANTFRAFATTLVEAALVILAGLQILSGSIVLVAAWLAVAVGYLGVGFAKVWRTSIATQQPAGRHGALDALSWVLPLAASVAGVNATILVLVRGDPQLDGSRWFLLTGSLAIFTSWLLLNSGFAQVYEAMHLRTPGGAFLIEHDESVGRPTLSDFVSLAFTIGTSFATSGISARTGRARLVVTVHSTLSFFYGALVVAVGFQVIQQLVRSTG